MEPTRATRVRKCQSSKNMIDDLITFINDLKKTENDIILMIDANEGFSELNSGISELLA